MKSTDTIIQPREENVTTCLAWKENISIAYVGKYFDTIEVAAKITSQLQPNHPIKLQTVKAEKKQNRTKTLSRLWCYNNIHW